MTANFELHADRVKAPGIGRRLACHLYEGLLLVALLLIASFPAAIVMGTSRQESLKLIYQMYMLCVVAAYFTWFWTHEGQTLPMKTWRMRVVDAHGVGLTFSRALLRCCVCGLFFGPACVGLVLLFLPKMFSPQLAVWMFLPLVATILWAKFDEDGQFLHDRFAGTRLVKTT